MQEYFETVHQEPGYDFPTTTAHDTLEEAIEFAEANNIETIYGEYDTWEKCWFCGEWFPITEMEYNLCEYCKQAIASHGG